MHKKKVKGKKEKTSLKSVKKDKTKKSFKNNKDKKIFKITMYEKKRDKRFPDWFI